MRELLREWGLDVLAPDAEVVLAELATNAVQAVRGEGRTDVGLGCVRQWMLGDLSRLLILVWDPSPWPPVVGEPGDGDEHGRGLLLVEALAARWRWYHPARPYGGKVVWALLEAAPWPRGTAGDGTAGGGVAAGGGPGRLEAVGR
jgi:anti-sigma regulatory factor (Ser/Thr protein kinase)